MYALEFTNQYLKDLKLARKRQFNEKKLNDVIKILVSGKKLPSKHKEHKLKGNFSGLFECHIIPIVFQSELQRNIEITMVNADIQLKRLKERSACPANGLGELKSHFN
jgi:mRNA interferase YafQ